MNRQHSMEQDPKIQTKSKHVDFQDEKNNSTRQKKTKKQKRETENKTKRATQNGTCIVLFVTNNYENDQANFPKKLKRR